MRRHHFCHLILGQVHRRGGSMQLYMMNVDGIIGDAKMREPRLSHADGRTARMASDVVAVHLRSPN
jgi:hypothetical protein